LSLPQEKFKYVDHKEEIKAKDKEKHDSDLPHCFKEFFHIAPRLFDLFSSIL
jgi:thiamine pyrophosphokinase